MGAKYLTEETVKTVDGRCWHGPPRYCEVIMRTDDDGKRWSTPSSSTQEKVTKQTKIRQKEGGKNI
jgi:hypothetical protein